MSASELRAHHALCTRFFRGKGYSPEFVRHMTAFVNRLEQEDPMLRLRTECDLLCAHCPHNRGGVCESKEKVERFDLAVLRFCELSPGTVIRASRLSQLTQQRILQAGHLAEVCGDCEWFPLCSSLLTTA